MIDRVLLRRLLLIAAALLAVSAGACALSGAPLLAGGLGLGFLLGAAPFVTWSWIISRVTGSTRGRALAVAVLAGKLAFYAAALYLGVVRAQVSPLGVMIGMTGVAFLLLLGGLWARTAPAKEVS